MNNDRSGIDLGGNDDRFFNISGVVGFLTSEKLAIGGVLMFSGRRQDFDNTTGTSFEISSSTFSLGPLVRYYSPFNSRTGFVLDMQLLAGVGSRKDTQFFLFGGDQQLEFDVFRIGLDVIPAFYYFATPKLALEASIGGVGYSFEQATGGDNGEEITQNTSNASLSLSTTLGIRMRYFFNKKTNG